MRVVRAISLCAVLLASAACLGNGGTPSPRPTTPAEAIIAAATAQAAGQATATAPATASIDVTSPATAVTPSVPVSTVVSTYVLQFHPANPARLYATFGPQVIPVAVDEAGAHAVMDQITNMGQHFVVALAYPTGGPFFAAGTGLLRRSRDDGVTWEPVPELGEADVYGLAADPASPASVYALVDRRGVLRTTDGGDSWEPTSAAFPAQTFGLWVLGTDPLRLATYDPAAGQLLASDDQGTSWDPLAATGLDSRPQQISLASDGRLYAATESGLLVSTDRGASWTQPDGGTLKNLFGVAPAPDNPDTVLALGLNASFFRSYDGGRTWKRRPSTPASP